MPASEGLHDEVLSMLRAGRSALPVVVDAEPIAADNPDVGSVHAQADEAGFHRIWASALFHRALDGYDAVLRLYEAELDTESRAHCRIAFEHSVSFAWVVAKPEDVTRPLRVGRAGMVFFERQMAELHMSTGLSHLHLNELRLATAIDAENLRPLPQLDELCRDVDEELAGRVEMSESFGTGYSYLYRGASWFVHPTAAGIEPLIEHVPGGFQVAPSRGRRERVLEVLAGQLGAVLCIAKAEAPWLVESHAA